MTSTVPSEDFGPEFDLARLESFLGRRFGKAGQFDCQRIAGGQSNPTYFVTYGDRRMVLRKKPAGPILKGAHAVEREYRVLEALQPTGVPVPKPILLLEDAEVIGVPFYLMERLDGRAFHDAALPGLAPAERRGIYLSMAETMAKLHAVDPVKIGLEDYGRPGNYFERQIARWTKQWQESDGEPIPEIDTLVDWLPRHLPPDDGRIAIAHGDLRLGNFFFHAEEPRVIAILDWELSTLGHPLADLAFCSMPWHTAPDEYGGVLGLDLETLGIPSEAEFVAHYYRHAEPTAPIQPFHVVFALFRFAVIFVGIRDRFRKGNAAGKNAASVGPLAKRFAVRGLEIAERGHH
ncbi:MAG: phosphotransferase family protein [Hyphomicrobiaceae bacterium]